MNEIARRFALPIVLVATAAVPARADTTADVQAKLDGALARVKSFVVMTRYPAQSYVSTLVFVAPDRKRVAIAFDANTSDVVTIGETTYSSKNGAPFERASVPPDATAAHEAAGHLTVAGLRPDVRTDGVAYGAFTTSVPFGRPMTLTCTYDKRTYRVTRCANDDVTQVFTDYDDPHNSVDAPTTFVEAPKTQAPKDGQ